MVRGDVCWVRLEPRSGSEQVGVRPCLIVSHDSFNRAAGWASVTVVPFTSSARWRRRTPTTVVLSAGEAGLSRECTALAHQVTTVDRSKLVEPPLGRLTPQRLGEVSQALRNYLELEP